MRITIMFFVTALILSPTMSEGQSSYNQLGKSCSCEDVLQVLLSDKMYYKHLYYGLTDSIYISQAGFCDTPWCKSYTIQGKTVTFVLSDTKFLQDQDKITQVWNISLAQKNNRFVCEIEGLISNNPEGSEHDHSIVVLEMKKSRGEYRVKKFNCFYVVGKSH